MINLMVGLSDPSASSGSASLNKQSPPISSQSFESQLSEAISEVLTKFGIDPGSIHLTVQDSTSGNIATRQNSAAVSTQLNTSVPSSSALRTEPGPAPTPA